MSDYDVSCFCKESNIRGPVAEIYHLKLIFCISFFSIFRSCFFMFVCIDCLDILHNAFFSILCKPNFRLLLSSFVEICETDIYISVPCSEWKKLSYLKLSFCKITFDYSSEIYCVIITVKFVPFLSQRSSRCFTSAYFSFLYAI